SRPRLRDRRLRRDGPAGKSRLARLHIRGAQQAERHERTGGSRERLSVEQMAPSAEGSIHPRGDGSRLARAGITTAITDGLFSSVLNVAAYGSTVSRLWQGVAATVVGNSAFTSGGRAVALGLLMHVGVAFTWSAVFVFGAMRSERIRSLLARRFGVLGVAAVYGPLIWMAMSLVVIPAL